MLTSRHPGVAVSGLGRLATLGVIAAAAAGFSAATGMVDSWAKWIFLGAAMIFAAATTILPRDVSLLSKKISPTVHSA